MWKSFGEFSSNGWWTRFAPAIRIFDHPARTHSQMFCTFIGWLRMPLVAD
jgi:hypothetical protein